MAALGYDLSGQALAILLNNHADAPAQFSEELLNAYISLVNHKQQSMVHVFDTMLTSVIMANIYNPERVRTILDKKGINLAQFERIFFPVVDISGSLQLIMIDM